MSDATTVPSDLVQALPHLTPRPSTDHPAYNCPPDRLVETVQYLRDTAGYDLLLDVTAIDWADRSPRFTGVYHLYDTTHHRYLRLAVDIADDAEPVLPSITGLYPAADWHERETYDMFGIRYLGHPDLRRILMWDGYPYFPLRKDFPLAGHEVEFPAADVAAVTGVKVLPAPMAGGPFRAEPGRPMSEMEPCGRDESWTEQRPKPATPETL